MVESKDCRVGGDGRVGRVVRVGRVGGTSVVIYCPYPYGREVRWLV